MTYLRKINFFLPFINFSENKECSSCIKIDRRSKSHFSFIILSGGRHIRQHRCFCRIISVSKIRTHTVIETPTNAMVQNANTYINRNTKKCSKRQKRKLNQTQSNQTQALECIRICYRIHARCCLCVLVRLLIQLKHTYTRMDDAMQLYL